MKLAPQRSGRNQTRRRGSVLILSLFLTGALGITLTAFLLIARADYTSSARSESWRRALSLAETGIEEGLAQINASGITKRTSGTSEARAAFGPVTRHLSGGAYDLFISEGATPTIYSTGHVTIPALSTTLSRVIVVTTKNGPLFTTAVGARTNIVNTGAGRSSTFSDSFDLLDAQRRTKANGQVACLSGSLDLGSSRVNGNVLLGPSASANTNVTAGTISHNLNMDFPEVAVPPTFILPALAVDKQIDGTSYRYVFLNDGEYSISTSGAIYVGSGAHVQLQIQAANFNAPAIYLAGTTKPAQLIIYALQPGFSLGGDAVVESGNAANLLYLGTPNNTSLTFNNAASFTGTIYAPSADFTYDITSAHGHVRKGVFTGSCVANSIKVRGAVTFHFDENLLRDTEPKSMPVSRPLVVSSWREL